ncbi:MAG TPA: type II secretion system F family protein [Gaiellaceae bacterium]|nr:type II secretion system F family protein [Gaiellaceae bacterium]
MLLLSALILGFAVFLLGEAATYPQRRRSAAVKQAARYGHTRLVAPHTERARFRQRVLEPAVKRLAAMALRLNPKTSLATIGARLLAAGFAPRISTMQFLAVKGALAIAAAATGAGLGFATIPLAGMLLAPLLAATGFLLPDAVLILGVRSRRERIRGELPDALDLLAVSVEAGLGLDGAITKLTEHMQGALVDEFALTLGEMRIGETRHDALRKMAERVPSPEVAAFVRSVIQADQLGISLGRILRVQAADSRLRRQAAAEERAMKAPIKMLFPTVIFIFPAMFLVILGPAFLNLAQYLR